MQFEVLVLLCFTPVGEIAHTEVGCARETSPQFAYGMHSLIPQQPSTRYPYVCGQKPSFPGRVARVPGHAKGWQPDSPACLRGEKGRTRKRWCACFFSSRQSIRVLTGGVFARGRRRRIDDFLVSGTGKPSSVGYWPLREGAHKV